MKSEGTELKWSIAVIEKKKENHLSFSNSINPFPPSGTMWYYIIFKKKDLWLLIFFQCNSKLVYIFPNYKNVIHCNFLFNKIIINTLTLWYKLNVRVGEFMRNIKNSYKCMTSHNLVFMTSQWRHMRYCFND